MKILVTGGDGFVGEHLIAQLLEEGVDITVSALRLPPDRNTLSPAQAAAVEWKVADVLDPDALYRLVAAVQPTRIFHLAGFASGARARAEPELALRVNAGGTVNLCEAVVAARRDFPGLDPQIVVAGSGDAYGAAAAAGEPLKEDSPLEPLSVYGLSKACQETVALGYRRARGLRTVVARPLQMIGPGQKSEFVVPSFAMQAAAIAAGRTEPILEVGNLDVERDLLDVRDGVRALRRLSELEEPRAVYNVCAGRAFSIRSVLEWILDEAGVEPEVRVDPKRVRSSDVQRLIGDASRLRAETGWSPQHDIEATVREAYRWLEGSDG